MKSEMYKLLNQMEVDLSEYPQEELTELERKRMKKEVTKSIMKTRKKKSYKGIAAAAVVALCAVGIAAGPLKSQVHAAVKYMSYSIGGYLGINQDLTPYEQVISQTIENDDLKITLNSVILDENELVVSTTEVYKNPLSENNPGLSANIYVNGRVISQGSSGSSQQIGDNTIQSVMNYDLIDFNTTESLDFELEFYFLGGQEKEKLKIAFQADGKELAIDTLNVPMEQSIRLPDESTITLNRYTDNALGQKIYYTSSKAGSDYDMKLEGQDDLGNPLSFTLSRVNGKEGRFLIDGLNGYVSESAKTLTLTLYAVEFPKESGKLSNNFEQVGEPIEIQVK